MWPSSLSLMRHLFPFSSLPQKHWPPLRTSHRYRSSGSGTGSSGRRTKDQSPRAAAVPLPPLRCPGGPRIKAEGLKHIFRVPHAGYLAKYDQRFILNLKLTHQIVSHLSRTTLRAHDKLLLELGPGVGALTRSLLTRPCVGVLGIESDERFNAHLEQIRQYTNDRFQWVNADVLRVNEIDVLKSLYPRFVEQHRRRPPAGEAKGHEGAPLRNDARERVLRKRFGLCAEGHCRGTASGGGRTEAHEEHSDFRSPLSSSSSPSAAFCVTNRWWSDGDPKLEVVANLPFDIITELLMRYAVDCSRHANLFVFGRVPLHIFTQKEIADRIIAPAGSIHFSRLSVLCQCYFHTYVRQTFKEMTYYPRTEVLGAMLSLQPRSQPLVTGMDAAALIHFTDILMRPGNRGMTVHKALQRGVPPEVAQYMLQELRMDGALTVLDLTVEEVCGLAVLWHRFVEASSRQQQQEQHHTTRAAASGNSGE